MESKISTSSTESIASVTSKSLNRGDETTQILSSSKTKEMLVSQQQSMGYISTFWGLFNYLLKSSKISVDKLLLQSIDLIRTEHDFLPLGLALRKGANPNIYVKAGDKNIHLLIYVYVKLLDRLSGLEKKAANGVIRLVILTLLSAGSSPDLVSNMNKQREKGNKTTKEWFSSIREEELSKSTTTKLNEDQVFKFPDLSEAMQMEKFYLTCLLDKSEQVLLFEDFSINPIYLDLAIHNRSHKVLKKYYDFNLVDLVKEKHVETIVKLNDKEAFRTLMPLIKDISYYLSVLIIQNIVGFANSTEKMYILSKQRNQELFNSIDIFLATLDYGFTVDNQRLEILNRINPTLVQLIKRKFDKKTQYKYPASSETNSVKYKTSDKTSIMPTVSNGVTASDAPLVTKPIKTISSTMNTESKDLSSLVYSVKRCQDINFFGSSDKTAKISSQEELNKLLSSKSLEELTISAMNRRRSRMFGEILFQPTPRFRPQLNIDKGQIISEVDLIYYLDGEAKWCFTSELYDELKKGYNPYNGQRITDSNFSAVLYDKRNTVKRLGLLKPIKKKYLDAYNDWKIKSQIDNVNTAIQLRKFYQCASLESIDSRTINFLTSTNNRYFKNDFCEFIKRYLLET